MHSPRYVITVRSIYMANGSFHQTIQDAVLVCRCLGIDCLWVDALCIVQDDVAAQDWYQQSLQMDSIYSHAHLVISAAVASACTQGFLPKDDLTWKDVTHVSSEGVKELRAACRRESDDRTPEGSMRNCALAKRGWTMQECVLPTRILHFGEHEVIWECNSGCLCECGNAAVHDLWKHADVSLMNRVRIVDDEFNDAHITDFLAGSTPDALCWVWERLVERYSQRALTVADDKLPAISGLARLFQSSLKASTEDYLAGVWKASLPHGLLWYVTGSPASSRPETWRAPSWSWAAIDGGVGFFYESYQFFFEPHLQILECSCQPSSVDDLGRIKQGHIRLRGILRPVILFITALRAGDEYRGQYLGYNGRAPRAHTDIIARVQRAGDWHPHEVLLDVRMDPGQACGEYYCLDVGGTYSRSHWGERISWLVLRKCVKKSGAYGDVAAFERVGIGMCNLNWMGSGTPFSMVSKPVTEEIVLL